jgi:hypothetical protein
VLTLKAERLLKPCTRHPNHEPSHHLWAFRGLDGGFERKKFGGGVFIESNRKRLQRVRPLPMHFALNCTQLTFSQLLRSLIDMPG